MNEVYRAMAVHKLDEWCACINARARIVYLLHGQSAGRYPGLRSLLEYYNNKSRRLWNDFRVAYCQAMASPEWVSG